METRNDNTRRTNETAGRCRKCDRVFFWVKRRGARELVKRAWCPFCILHLRNTAASLICSARVRFVRDPRPHFADFRPLGLQPLVERDCDQCGAPTTNPRFCSDACLTDSRVC